MACVSLLCQQMCPDSDSHPSTDVLPAGDLSTISAVCSHISFMYVVYRTAQIESGEADVADAQLLRGCVTCQPFVLCRVRYVRSVLGWRVGFKTALLRVSSNVSGSRE